MRRILQLIAVLLAIGLISVGGALAAAYAYNRPSEGIPEGGRIFQVKEGAHLAEVSRSLEDAGLVRSRYFLVILARIRETEGRIKTGYYRILPQMSALDIHDMLVEGRQTLHKVTIPEGLKIRSIAALFEEAGICKAEEFIAESRRVSEHASEKRPLPEGLEDLQGYLSPDTYLFQRDFPADRVVAYMVETFYGKIDELAPEHEELSAEELHEKVILASIVEREYRAEDEAAKIASVFYNRLKAGMRLQSCATVVYVLTEERGRDHPKKLTFDDLAVESPFNTYTNRGLPPAPIANPGEGALDAVFHPAETDYLYFLLQDPDAGRHSFSRTLSEHNRAYRLYIKN